MTIPLRALSNAVCQDPSSDSFLDSYTSQVHDFMEGSQLNTSLKERVGHRFFRRPPLPKWGLVELKKESPPLESSRSQQDILPHPAQAMIDVHDDKYLLPPPPAQSPLQSPILQRTSDSESQSKVVSLPTELGGNVYGNFYEEEESTGETEEQMTNTVVQTENESPALSSPLSTQRNDQGQESQPAAQESNGGRSGLMNLLTGPLGLVTGKMFKPPVLPPSQQIDPSIHVVTVEHEPTKSTVNASVSVQSFDHLVPILHKEVKMKSDGIGEPRVHRRPKAHSATPGLCFFRGDFDPPDRRRAKIDSSIQTDKHLVQEIPPTEYY